MEHGREAARPTTVGSAEVGMAGAVRGSEASGAFDDAQFSAAAARRFGLDAFEPGAAAAAYHNNPADELARHVRAAAARGEVLPVATGFHFHHRLGPGMAYANIGEFWRQPGPVRVELVGPQLPDGVVLLSGGGGGAVDNGYYALQPRPDAGHGEVFVGLLPGGVDAVYHTSGEFARHVRTDARRGGEVPVAVFHREPGPGVAYTNIGEFWQHPGLVQVVLAGPQLPDAVVPVHDNNYGYYPWQPRSDAERGEVFIGPLPDGVGAVFANSGNFAQQTPPGTGRADGIAGALRGRNLGAGHDSSGALAGAAYNNLGTVAEHLRRLLPFAGVGACSVAVNGLAAGPGSPAVALDLFAMFLGGLLLVILHVLRV